jgi:hypothetical protein
MPGPGRPRLPICRRQAQTSSPATILENLQRCGAVKGIELFLLYAAMHQFSAEQCRDLPRKLPRHHSALPVNP